MAGHVTIEEYLAAFDRRLRGRPDRDELLDEVEDHLRTTAEAAMARGASAMVAETTTVERFGDAAAIADALADANGSPAVPTHFSRSAGTVALVSGGLWLVFGVCWTLAVSLDDGDWTGPPRIAFTLATAALAAASALGVAVIAALSERHGGLGWTGRIALAAAGVAVPAALLSWFVAGWGTLISVAWLVLGVRLLQRDIAPRRAVLVTSLAWPVGLGTFAALRVNRFGSADEWGAYPAATLTGVVVGATLMTAGMFAYGHWLHGEEPVALGADERVVA